MITPAGRAIRDQIEIQLVHHSSLRRVSDQSRVQEQSLSSSASSHHPFRVLEVDPSADVQPETDRDGTCPSTTPPGRETGAKRTRDRSKIEVDRDKEPLDVNTTVLGQSLVRSGLFGNTLQGDGSEARPVDDGGGFCRNLSSTSWFSSLTVQRVVGATGIRQDMRRETPRDRTCRRASCGRWCVASSCFHFESQAQEWTK